AYAAGNGCILAIGQTGHGGHPVCEEHKFCKSYIFSVGLQINYGDRRYSICDAFSCHSTACVATLVP
ncbi:MAG: hypothetical protein AAAC47_10185, partial [Pararhizobium sp.]